MFEYFGFFSLFRYISKNQEFVDLEPRDSTTHFDELGKSSKPERPTIVSRRVGRGGDGRTQDRRRLLTPPAAPRINQHRPMGLATETAVHPY